MAHEHETPTDGTTSAATALPASGEGEPAFLARARRILGGDIRPEDYLPITPEVRAAADFELANLHKFTTVQPLPEVIAHQLRGWVLSFHHGGENILYIEDDKGVIVLAAGVDQVGKFIREIPDKLQSGVTADVPEPF